MNLNKLKLNIKLAFKQVVNNLQDLAHNINISDHKFIENIMSAVHNPTPKSTLFPYTYFDEETKLFSCDNGVKGFALLSDPVVGIDKNAYKQISLLFDDQLPLGGILQVFLIASDDIDNILKEWSESRLREDEIYKKLSKYKIENYHVHNKSNENNFKHRNYRLYFFYSEAPKKGNSDVSILGFKEKLKPILSSIGIAPQDVKEAEFLKLIREIVNYPELKRNGFNPFDPLGNQITDLSTNLLIDKDCILHSGREYVTKCFQIKSFPEEGFNISSLIDLFGSEQENMQIPSRFIIHYMIANDIPDSKQQELKAKGDLVIKQANSGIAVYTPGIKEEAKEWNKILDDNLKKKERFLTTSFLVSVTAKSDVIRKCEQNLVSLWRKSDMTLQKVKYFLLPALLSMCPFLPTAGLLAQMKRFDLSHTALSSEPKALMPIVGEWKGETFGGMLLTGRRGQLFAWNSFRGANNYNVSIIGGSGSGKSVFLQEFIMSHLAQGARVFVVDIGKSFEKTCKILKGDFVHFSTNSKISVNPFVSIPVDNKKVDLKFTKELQNGSKANESNLTSDSLNMIKYIIRKMAAPKSGTTDFQDAVIAKALSDTWNIHGKNTSIDRLSETLAKSEDRRYKDLSSMLYEYTSKGNYGRFFIGDGIKFDKDLTVLEFEELRERPDLGGVIMQMLSIQIVQQVYLGNRKQKFIILFDEAWYALKQFPQMLAEMAKTVRKYNGALALGTQSLTDYYGADDMGSSTEEARARSSIMENMAWRVFLRQESDSAEKAAKAGLKNHVSLIKSLETIPKKYSESLICKSEKEYFISRLMLDPFAGTLYSSTPETVARINAFTEQGMSIGSAIEKVMRAEYG